MSDRLTRYRRRPAIIGRTAKASDRRGSVLVLVMTILGVLFVTGIAFMASMNFDAELVIDLAGNTGDVLASDDDSGGGVMGWDPSVTFTADESASYLIGVFDQTGVGPGGYFLRVKEG